MTNNANKKNPFDTICDLKWNYPIFMLNRGEFRSCCRTTPNTVSNDELVKHGIDAFLNSEHMRAGRRDLINGVKSPDCRTCWKLEDAGAPSPRSHPREFWRQMQDEGHFAKGEYDPVALLKQIQGVDDINHPMLYAKKPKLLEISLGNTCDMKCMYCSHHYSTQWAAERIKVGEITQEQYDTEFPKTSDLYKEKFWEWFSSVARYSVNRIGLIGGEPLIIPEFYDFMDRIMESVHEIEDQRTEKLTLWIVTNLNTPPAYLEKFFNYLPQITKHFNLDIYISMESLENKAEYIRNGIIWDRYSRNLHKLLQSDHKFNLGFILSQNVLSITSIKPVVQFIERLTTTYGRPIAIKQSTVTHPTWQNPMILTPDFANYIDEAITYMLGNVSKMPIVEDYYGRYDQYIKFLQNMSDGLKNNTQTHTADRKQFASWFDTYDQRRKLNLLETFPEYTEFYNLCKSL